MSPDPSLEGSVPPLPPRILGRVRGDEAGPTLIVIGGLHGNEPAGVEAAQRVLTELATRDVGLRGEFVALTGNRPALAQGTRFVDVDLNRLWAIPGEVNGPADVDAPTAGEAPEPVDVSTVPPDEVSQPVEIGEKQELLEAVESAAGQARGNVFVLDLHTTSAPGGGFTAVGDTLANRAFARSIPVPLVLGLEELVDGTLLEHLDDRGFVSAVFETGQHGEPAAVYRAEAGIWVALGHAGLVNARGTPRVRSAYHYLRLDTRVMPDVVEMKFRHGVRPSDGFRMREGYGNFQRIFEGEALADSDAGPIRSPLHARILMPLYQEQGDDGFFVVHEFHTFWLGVSAFMRRIRLGRLLPWFPGVRLHEGKLHVVEIDRGIARFFALQWFHLLGYRKQREVGGKLFMIRRPNDVGD